MNEYYHWYKEHGLCPHCNAEKIAKGKAACLNCLSINAEAARKRRDNFTPEQKAKADKQCDDSHKRLYNERKAAGICVKCGKHKARQGHVRCVECTIKLNRAAEKHRRKIGVKPHYMLTEYDVCYICGREPLQGKRLCAVHYDIAMQNLKKANEHRDNTNHIWRKLRYGKEQKE